MRPCSLFVVVMAGAAVPNQFEVGWGSCDVLGSDLREGPGHTGRVIDLGGEECCSGNYVFVGLLGVCRCL
jgi:hypothetical protein